MQHQPVFKLHPIRLPVEPPLGYVCMCVHVRGVCVCAHVCVCVCMCVASVTEWACQLHGNCFHSCHVMAIDTLTI